MHSKHFFRKEKLIEFCFTSVGLLNRQHSGVKEDFYAKLKKKCEMIKRKSM